MPTIQADVARSFAVPGLSYGESDVEGVAVTVIRSDATLAVLDATNPTTIVSADSPTPGTAAIAAHRDHRHGAPTVVANPLTANLDLGANRLVGNAGSLGIDISAAGEVTLTGQPSFLARNNAAILNVTGGGTVYTGVFATEVFDQNADFDGTSTFTAPVTGRYALFVKLLFTGVTSGMTTCSLDLVTSNRTYLGGRINPANVSTASGDLDIDLVVIADLDAGDTVTVQIALGNGTDVADFSGGADGRTIFGGQLIA